MNEINVTTAFFDALDASYCHLTAYNLTGNCRTSSCRDPEYPNPNVPPLNLSSSTPLLSPDAFIILNAYHGPLMCGAHPPTKVISISYSGTEHTWPANYMRRQCLEIMKLALQGITVVESSGDVGVGGGRYNSQVGCLGANRTVYAPRVMSNCPYVLSVGATMLVDKDDGTASWREVAAEGVSSGGGFSNIFPRPWWQNKAVTEFLNSNPQIKEKGYILKGEEGFSNSSVPEGKVFNLAGRAYPDVAAIGENFKVVWKGYPNRMDGTSVAVPIWASILTLINEERLAVGKGPVGFVHPVLVSSLHKMDGRFRGLTSVVRASRSVY
jgi:Predicted protease